MRTVKLECCTPETTKAAAQFVAELLRQGLTFDAQQRGDFLIVTLTGGY